MKRFVLCAVQTVVCAALVACGGGDSGNPPSKAEGLWIGTSSNDRTVLGLVLDDGTYWVLYTLAGNDAVIAGVIQGALTGNDLYFASSNGRDFNLEGLGILPVTVTGSYVERQTLAGAVSYPTLGQQITFESAYDDDYESSPDLAVAAGRYSGSAATSGGTESASISVSAGGALSGSSASGCGYSGSVAPRSSGNVYNVTVTFHGGACANGNDTVRGVAYFDAGANQILSAALNGARTDGFIFSGVKQ